MGPRWVCCVETPRCWLAKSAEANLPPAPLPIFIVGSWRLSSMLVRGLAEERGFFVARDHLWLSDCPCQHASPSASSKGPKRQNLHVINCRSREMNSKSLELCMKGGFGHVGFSHLEGEKSRKCEAFPMLVCNVHYCITIDIYLYVMYVNKRILGVTSHSKNASFSCPNSVSQMKFRSTSTGESTSRAIHVGAKIFVMPQHKSAGWIIIEEYQKEKQFQPAWNLCIWKNLS